MLQRINEKSGSNIKNPGHSMSTKMCLMLNVARAIRAIFVVFGEGYPIEFVVLPIFVFTKMKSY